MPRQPSRQASIAAQASAIPIGERIEDVLRSAYAARRPVLLSGPTGIGKSELVEAFAARAGIGFAALDLSLLEPPDLTGMPYIDNGATRFAPPSMLPQGGAGILMLEELNRAEPYVLHPALQLLSARRLNEYVLPAGWSIVAAVNPDDADYQVRPLDAAMRARFLMLTVRADRQGWLAWARRRRVHPGVMKIVSTHDKALEDIAPRTWSYVSDLLRAMAPQPPSANPRLLRDALGGYLPPTWVEALLGTSESWCGVGGLEPHRLLAGFARDTFARGRLGRLIAEGQTDKIETVVYAIECTLLDDAEVAALISGRNLDLPSFEALLLALPGDFRQRLQEAFGASSFTAELLPVKPADVLCAFASGSAAIAVRQWAGTHTLRHRVWALATAIERQLGQLSAKALRESKPGIEASLRAFLVHLQGEAAATLTRTAMQRGVLGPQAGQAGQAARGTR